VGAEKLRITVRELRGVTVVDLSGRLVFGEESRALRERLKELLAEKKTRLVLNLREVNFIDSSGAGALVACLTSARPVGGDLRMANINRYFREFLEMTRLLNMMDVFNSEEEAVASFG
jgi:anti-sigma B factor antagonist